MKYFFDTEFIEGFSKSFFSKKRHFIDLISIGIVDENDKKLYLVSNEYNYNDADTWVKDNVILPLYISMVHGDQRNYLTVQNFHKVLGVSNKEIAKQIKIFCDDTDPKFYAYYADYDWVLFCSLFGTMMNLPKTFPMYCRDLKQMLDESQEKRNQLKQYIDDSKGALDKHEENSMVFPLQLQDHSYYPKQENEHSALDDANWNYELYKFLKKVN